MTFRVPSFNLAVNVWHFPNTPPAAPDFVTPGNLAWGRRVNVAWEGSVSGFGDLSLVMTLLLPVGTDVRSKITAAPNADVVEVPAGTGRFYIVLSVDDIGKGFPNEHRAATVQQATPGGVPWPSPIP